jgi:hypothetical protein
MKSPLLVVFLLACGAAAAADRDFDRVVKAIESHYGTRHTRIPMMGFANFVVKVARPAGTSSFHLAMFDHLDTPPEERDEFMENIGSGSLHPLIRVHSNRDREATYILAGDAGKTTRMLIAIFGRDAATVIEVKVNAEALRKTIERPDLTAQRFLGKQNDY